MWTPAALVAFDSLRNGPEWRRWSELAKAAPPYLAPEFFATVRPLVEAGTPLVAEAWTADRMLGALPLVLAGDRLRGLRTEHSPGFDYCGDEGGIDAIWDSLRDDDRWNELVLEGLPADSPISRRLPELARRDGCPVSVRPDSRHPYFALAGFEAAMHPKFRANVQRCARKAGDLVLERILAPGAADLAQATRIEGLAWKQAAGTAIASDARVAHVYEELARRPEASLYFLRIKGERMATMFALEDAHTLFALKVGYDPAYAALSPGHLLVWKVAKDAEARGLAELNFVGREDEWKKRWTDRVHEHVAVTVYRRSARGLVRYALRDVIRPILPEPVRTTPHSPLPRHCQRADFVGNHALLDYVRGRLAHGFGIRSRLKRRAPVGQGAPSQFPVGSWVRVVGGTTLRGLKFTTVQDATIGHVYKVERHVRRLRDDHGRYRAIDRTVLLEGVDCGDPPLGCGRHCPMMYRDEWLEAAEAPHEAQPVKKLPHARVKNLGEIHATLDLAGRRDGLTFLPEMAAFAGKRLPIVEKIDQVFELDRWIATSHPLYILGGAHCTGAVLGARGPCDRACALLWHQDWLVIE